MTGKKIIDALDEAISRGGADVTCPKCGVKHFMLYGSHYRCPCGHYGKIEDESGEARSDE